MYCNVCQGTGFVSVKIANSNDELKHACEACDGTGRRPERARPTQAK
ncbi:hypothetical protein KCMC57_up53420 [Kitasatospora sp. CMC57]|uniref:Molecular chaperone DnaJ n=1 Tax=Kitasatospora sp. CMC57 TaxID=3231513 RepID=A0AB33K2B3_9ACTN